MLSNSVGEVGTLRITIFLPSVEPIPIEAKDRIEATSENILPDPQSLNIYEPVRVIDWAATTGLDIAVPWSCVGCCWLPCAKKELVN